MRIQLDIVKQQAVEAGINNQHESQKKLDLEAMIAEERSVKQEQRRLGTAKGGYAKGQGKSSLRLKTNAGGNQTTAVAGGLRSSMNGIPFP